MEQKSQALSPIVNVKEVPNIYENHLHVLLLGMVKEFNLPFESVENPRIQELILHLNPNVTLPTVNNLFQAISEQIQPPYTIGFKYQKTDEVTDQVFPLNLSKMPLLDGIANGKGDMANTFCIICLECHPHSTVRKLTKTEAAMFLFVTVAEGVHSMGTAQTLFRQTSHRSCVHHYNPVFQAGLKHLEIGSPNEVCKASDQAVANVYSINQTIQKPSFAKHQTMKPNPRNAGSFRLSLQCFFKKYIIRPEVSAYIPLTPTQTPSPKPELKKLESCSYLDPDNTFPDDFLETE